MLAIRFGKRARPAAPDARSLVVGAGPQPNGIAAPKRSRYIDAEAEHAAWLLAQRSSATPVLLGWLRGNNRLALPAQGGMVEGRAHLLLSDQHAAIVAISRGGERSYSELEPGRYELHADGAELRLNAPNALFVVSGRAREPAGELVALLPLGPIERLLEGARLNRKAGGRAGNAQASALLALALARGSVRAIWLTLLSAPDALDDALLERAIASERVSPAQLGELWQAWQFSPIAAHALVEALCSLGERALPWALALHDRARNPESVSVQAARAELALAATRAHDMLVAEPGEPRAHALERVLSTGGLAHSAQATPQAPLAVLSDELLRERVTHPASRKSGLDFWRAPALLARVGKRASPEDLGDYCEPLLPSSHPAATRAVAAASRALGLPPLPTYVSRGKKSLGLCSQRGAPASLLIGVEHLTEGSAYALSEPELWFAIGAECAHLRLGHGRVTRHELWAGALAHTREGLGLALGLLPILRGARLGLRVSRALARVPEPALERALAVLSGVELTRLPASGPRAHALSHFNEELLASHRVTQLSADRAGLVLAGDLGASLRALLVVRPDYRALLGELESTTLADGLLARGPSPMLTDLIVRCAALLVFYLSEDYAVLRAALFGGREGGDTG